MKIQDYERKGISHETEILKNMLSLWSPFIGLESIGYSGDSRVNPSNPVEITYDFELLVKDYPKHKGTEYYYPSEGFIRGLTSFRNLAQFYPLIKNLGLDNLSAGRRLLNGELKGIPEGYKVGRYYMGGDGLVIYIDEINEDFPIVYVLNLWSENKGEKMLPHIRYYPEDVTKQYQLKGEFKPWFNIYVATLNKLKSDYPLDVTEWINPLRKVSFMNWNENPFEVK